MQLGSDNVVIAGLLLEQSVVLLVDCAGYSVIDVHDYDKAG